MPQIEHRSFEDIIELLKSQIAQTKNSIKKQVARWNGINLESIRRAIHLALKNPVTDNQNIALLYYLPNLLAQNEQHEIFDSTSLLSQKLYASIVPKDEKSVWRVNEKYFTPVKRPKVAPGCLNFSPGWLAQGHHALEYPLVTSLSLSQGNEAQSLQWLERIEKMQILSNILLRLLHPELHYAGLVALSGLRQNPMTSKWAIQWKSVFNCLSVISSRISKEHRDSSGDNKFFDILFNLGFCEGAEMYIKELGAQFRYRPGTVFIFSGKLWTHEVPPWTTGEHVLYAYFMRPEVLNRFISSPVGWALLPL
ncbi:hypothetical protein GG344DRAFT_69513 [Lentinula edodes]|nr:hypothetical protein GG344DRAFT_69513 [Lentinula edodes]